MNGCTRFVFIALLVAPTISVAQAGELASPAEPNAAVSGVRSSTQRTIKGLRANVSTPLDRIAYAVDGAESSHGADLAMWRSDPSGPQGPMQVSEAAAADVGGGDRFDSTENRALGRAYLVQLYRRYKNWPDAIAAYNWGMGNVDNWINAGRPPDKFVPGVAAYLRRVLHDSGMCDGSTAVPIGPPRARTLPADRQSREAPEEDAHPEADSFALAACADLEAWGGILDEKDQPLLRAQGHFYSKLESAMALAMQHLSTSQRSADTRATVSSKTAVQRR
jgi:Transglycosylase SLT domain